MSTILTIAVLCAAALTVAAAIDLLTLRRCRMTGHDWRRPSDEQDAFQCVRCGQWFFDQR
jgi:hypothetical protein